MAANIMMPCHPSMLQHAATHLAAKPATKNAVNEGGGTEVRRGLWGDAFERYLVHGIHQATQELMGVLLTAQFEPGCGHTTSDPCTLLGV